MLFRSVKTGQDVQFQGAIWDQWKCAPNDPALRFNRVDVAIGKATQDLKLSAAHLVCQSPIQKVAGVYKAHKKDVNPGTTLPHHEVWSANFVEKCTHGVDVYLQPVDPANHPVIKQVSFTNTTITPTPTPPPPTPTKPPPNGQCNKAKQNVLFQDKT